MSALSTILSPFDEPVRTSVPEHHCILAPRVVPTNNKQEIHRTYFSADQHRQLSTMLVKGYVRMVEVHSGRQLIYIGGREEEGCKRLHDAMEAIFEGDKKEAKSACLTVPWTLTTEDGEYLVAITVADDVVVEGYNFLDPCQPLSAERVFTPGMLIDCVFHLHIVGRRVKRFGKGKYGYAYKWVLEATRVIKYGAFDRFTYPAQPPRLLIFREEDGKRELHDVLTGAAVLM